MQFLADAHPSHLLPPSESVSNALYRARIAFFVDTLVSKVLPQIFGGWRAQSEAEKDTAAEGLASTVAKELEPLFNWGQGKGPFFGGSERLTLAEVSLFRFIECRFMCGPSSTVSLILTSPLSSTLQVLTGPFLLRALSFGKPEYGIMSPKTNTLLEDKAPKFKAWAEKVVQEPSVTYIWDEKMVAKQTKARMTKMAAEKKL